MLHLILLLLGSLLTLALAASVSETILQIPLFEVGALWASASSTLFRRVLTSLFSPPSLSAPSTYVAVATLVGVVYGFWALMLRPLNRVRKLGDVGYVPEGVFSAKESANFVQKRRKVGKIPPPYPNGWFGLMESFTLKKQEAQSVSVLGQNLAVFRDETGAVHCLDAYCPHMGANLAAGGRVVNGCIECPFHAWRFRGIDGKCVSIPAATGKIPEVARVRAWPCVERTGWIFIWHHSDGVEPTWEIPVIDEIEEGSWVYKGRTEHHVNAHIEEIPENGADVAHLASVHGPIMAAGSDLRTMWSRWWSFAEHQWSANWQPCDEPDTHVGTLSLTHDIAILGVRLPFLNLRVSARQIGPAVVYLEFESFFGRGAFLHIVTPMEPLVQKVVHNIYMTSWMPTCVAKFYMLGEALQIERDVMIWNNKIFHDRPLFVKSKEDSLIQKHRRWYAQFYSKNNMQDSIFKKETLDF